MKIHNQFLKLYQLHAGTDELSVTLGEIAGVLDCTQRNALMIIRKMESRGWISWQARRGRGRRSQLTFLIGPGEVAAESMIQAVERREIKQAVDDIRTYARSASMQEHLQGWLLQYFGHHTTRGEGQSQVDTLRIPLRQQLHTFDPLSINLLAESFVTSHIFDGLVRRDECGRILPHLALGWEISEDRTRWSFVLRKEVFFHNGKLLAADDVVFSIRRLMQSSGRMLYSFIVRNILSVQASGPSEVEFTLKEPNELFLPFLCTSRAVIVPRELDHHPPAVFARSPVGTGPFKLADSDQGLCVLEVFRQYFRGRAQLDRVEIVQLPWNLGSDEEDSPDQTSPFHIIHHPTTPGTTSSSGGNSSGSHIQSGSYVRKFITFNTQKTGPLQDTAIRASICRMLEMDRFNRDSDAAFRDNIKPGSSGSLPLPVELTLATIPQYRQEARTLADLLERNGCSCRLNVLSVEAFKGSSRMEADLILFSLIRDQDMHLRQYDLYETLAGHVEPHSRIDIERLLRQAAQTYEEAARTDCFLQIEERLIQAHQLHILYERPVQTAYLPSVRGVSFNSQGWVDLRHIWFPPKR
ncbi:ABC transporter substrate-binding protein [Paenibacillus sp. JX-17]|uniref:ABC transporter substrate-binding protein n=1 Tax=Paenibacillus lacisoli TaxID=3064525 RepID=A0ABT9CCH1_9BACL|nr:ABC transporter substrate-binding protein [Paenibacillus sp. JX-17]MDO7906965.1 ABC transporter substrate-binding protein [Paenibacillus sp. JX-17]